MKLNLRQQEGTEPHIGVNQYLNLVTLTFGYENAKHLCVYEIIT